MARVLIWLLIAGLVWWMWRSRTGPRRAAPAPPKPAAPTQALSMVSCLHCGVHVPSQEAVSDAQGQVYCCTAHRQLGPGPQT